MTAHRRLTQAGLLAELEARFGPNPLDWAFQCPHCGDIAAAEEFSEALAAHPRKNRDGSATTASDVVGQECIGRTLGALEGPASKWKGRGCDWTAYGLFGGPWTVELPGDKTMHCFPIAPVPVRTGADDGS